MLELSERNLDTYFSCWVKLETLIDRIRKGNETWSKNKQKWIFELKENFPLLIQLETLNRSRTLCGIKTSFNIRHLNQTVYKYTLKKVVSITICFFENISSIVKCEFMVEIIRYKCDSNYVHGFKIIKNEEENKTKSAYV